MEPIVVTDTSKRSVSIRLASDNLVVTETRYAIGEQGPDPHVHHLHADCFYVLAGTLTLSLDDGDHVLGAETFALVPPDVVHSFRNNGPDDLRFLNLHAPGMGFDRYLQGLYDNDDDRSELALRFDQHPPPEGGGRDPSLVIVRTTNTDAVAVGGVHIGFLANADEALEAMCLVEYKAPPSFPGPPPHIHDRTWDAYYVLEGCLSVRLGDERVELLPGDVAVVPPGVVHGFSNALDTPTRFLDIHAPGGFERYFREIAAALADGPPDPTVMAKIASGYDIRTV